MCIDDDASVLSLLIESGASELQTADTQSQPAVPLSPLVCVPPTLRDAADKMADKGAAVYPIHTGSLYRKLVCIIRRRRRRGRRPRRRRREEYVQYTHD
ncbi:hypothetical protein ABVT39_024335 [Epinephelus coioides]